VGHKNMPLCFRLYLRRFLSDCTSGNRNTENGRSAFLRSPLGDLGATYDDHLRLIGKRVVDFLLVSNERFR